MKIVSAEFVTSAATQAQWPELGLPQIAFAGRSNVGKSSLINSLTGRKGLVKVSKTPGKTQLLNFFTINRKIAFVDMPGYGFAKVPLSVKKSWGSMVETFLKKSGRLKGVAVLLDIRRTPGDEDKNLLGWLCAYNVPYVIVFTKADKFPKTRRPGMVKKALAEVAEYDQMLAGHVLYSSLTNLGRMELWGAIKGLLAAEES